MKKEIALFLVILVLLLTAASFGFSAPSKIGGFHNEFGVVRLASGNRQPVTISGGHWRWSRRLNMWIWIRGPHIRPLSPRVIIRVR